MITQDGYASVPWGKRFVIIYQGEQIHDVATENQAITYIRKQQKLNKQGATKTTGTRSRRKTV